MQAWQNKWPKPSTGPTSPVTLAEIAIKTKHSGNIRTGQPRRELALRSREMQNRFVVLTGHLNDYPLADLVGILRHQRKTGRLLIEYPKGPASFFFVEGRLADAQLQNLVGLQAVCLALAQPASPFNFNPLIQPSRQSIDNSVQRVV